MRKSFTLAFFYSLIIHSYCWMNGLNMPWNNCGNDFGSNLDKTAFSNAFSKYRNDGANTVRVWIFFNGDKSLQLYDSSGHFKTLPNNFYDDLKYVLNLAYQNSLKIHFTLFSFECVNV